MNKFYAFLWDTTENLYKWSDHKIDIGGWFPSLGPWLFGKMIRRKGIQMYKAKGKLKLIKGVA